MRKVSIYPKEDIVELINKRFLKNPLIIKDQLIASIYVKHVYGKKVYSAHAKKNGDYCDKHNRMIKIDGLLRFGDIREERPAYDLIKQQQGDLVRLQWIEPDPMKRLQNLLDKQQQKIINSTSRIYL